MKDDGKMGRKREKGHTPCVRVVVLGLALFVCLVRTKGKGDSILLLTLVVVVVVVVGILVGQVGWVERAGGCGFRETRQYHPLSKGRE